MTYFDPLNHIKTLGQAREFISEIEMLIYSLFKSQNSLEQGLNSISTFDPQMLRESLLKNGIDTNNLSAVKEFLEGLKHQIQQLKAIKLTLAFEPRESTIDNLSSWVSQNLTTGLVLDISVDKSILGGAIIEYEGKYEDLSLRKRIEEVFGRKREEIMSFEKTQ